MMAGLNRQTIEELGIKRCVSCKREVAGKQILVFICCSECFAGEKTDIAKALKKEWERKKDGN